MQIGLGGTYHFWGTTGGVVLRVTIDWSDARYELGFFRVTTQQVLYDSHSPNGRLMADPYWGMSLSRRWRLYERGPVRLFFSFAAKTESDQLSSTRLDVRLNSALLGAGARSSGLTREEGTLLRKLRRERRMFEFYKNYMMLRSRYERGDRFGPNDGPPFAASRLLSAEATDS